MSRYFSIPLLGSGTWEVESLKHYVSRAADAHSLTPTQFFQHVGAWWASSHPGEKGFPGYIYHAKGSPICGYGQDVARAATILEEATGQDGLRAGTLCALHGVGAPSRIRTLKRLREWCPACFREDRDKGEPYERLIWLIEGFTRCPIHRIELQSRCPRCHGYQSLRVGAKVDECESCGASLSIDIHKCSRAARPAFVESDVVGLIQLFASNPYIQLPAKAIHHFFYHAWFDYRHYLEEFVRENELGRSVHLPDVTFHSRPTLSTMITIARLTDVPLPLILEEPDYAARLFLSATVDLPQTPFAWHRLHGRETHEAIDQHLRNALVQASGGKLCDLKGSLRKSGVSLGYARYWFPEYCEQLASSNKEIRIKVRSEHVAAVRTRISRHKLMEKYIAGTIGSQDEMVEFLVARTGAPIWIVRNEVQLACRKASLLKETAEWAVSKYSSRVLGAARIDKLGQ